MIQMNMATEKDESRAAVKGWLWVRDELMAW